MFFFQPLIIRLIFFVPDLGDSADSMTLIVASSTSSSPIHNHRQPIHQHNHYNNMGQYHQGVMTLRRPVVTQYYGAGGGTLQRNVMQQQDVSGVNQYK